MSYNALRRRCTVRPAGNSLPLSERFGTWRAVPKKARRCELDVATVRDCNRYSMLYGSSQDIHNVGQYRTQVIKPADSERDSSALRIAANCSGVNCSGCYRAPGVIYYNVEAPPEHGFGRSASRPAAGIATLRTLRACVVTAAGQGVGANIVHCAQQAASASAS